MPKHTENPLAGVTADEFFEQYRGKGVPFSSILFHNDHLDFIQKEISLRTRLTREHTLEIPIVSSPMDTVTKARMVRAINRMGGTGVIYLMQPHEQARDVSKAKQGLIVDPLVLDPQARIELVECVRLKYSHIPITESADPKGKILGIVTDGFRPFPQHETVGECMQDPITILATNILRENRTVIAQKALAEMDQRSSRYLVVVDEDDCLVGLIVASDLNGSTERHPITQDAQQRDFVLAAINTNPGDYERRVPRLVESGIDGFCIDTAHGDSRFVLETLEWLKREYEEKMVIAGNISTAAAAERLINAGADALRVGNGPGGVCTTHNVTRVGATQPGAIYRTAQVARKYNIPLIADGGIQNSGDIITALALGADCVMLGTLLAPLPESAAPIETVIIDGKPQRMKVHRGMASADALSQRVISRYEDMYETHAHAPEGEKKYLEPATESTVHFLAQLTAGIRQGMNYLAVRSIPELHKKVQNGIIRMEHIE